MPLSFRIAGNKFRFLLMKEINSRDLSSGGFKAHPHRLGYIAPKIQFESLNYMENSSRMTHAGMNVNYCVGMNVYCWSPPLFFSFTCE